MCLLWLGWGAPVACCRVCNICACCSSGACGVQPGSMQAPTRVAFAAAPCSCSRCAAMPLQEWLAGLTDAEPGPGAGSGDPVRAHHGGSSSDKAAAPAVQARLCEAAPLLPKGAGPSAPSLRCGWGTQQGGRRGHIRSLA
ncbi:hypothetical protein ABPG77_003108 [Micractinium sp. CCAP 211/92]